MTIEIATEICTVSDSGGVSFFHCHRERVFQIAEDKSKTESSAFKGHAKRSISSNSTSTGGYEKVKNWKSWLPLFLFFHIFTLTFSCFLGLHVGHRLRNPPTFAALHYVADKLSPLDLFCSFSL
ncbi:hypothetical protein VNO77_04077 [Canavalia gladiata]|uniref:Transmembrane protein n=1 Tax=Canavalia gladiata TaxID=3824 RepID=A0AAN9MWR1_CANGL